MRRKIRKKKNGCGRKEKESVLKITSSKKLNTLSSITTPIHLLYV